jgi:deazaflavin-dependent oxidoreductase (nitroreductase family)
LGHLPDGDDVIVAASNGGKPTLPAWFYNLRANPQVEVEIGTERFPARARFLEGEEWQQHWDRLVKTFPIYDQARRFSGRTIPLVRLCREPKSGREAE